MPASTRVRAAIVVAALGGAAAGYAWWTSPARQIHRVLTNIASALSHDGDESDLRALSSVASLQAHLAAEVSIEAGEPPRALRGRQEVAAIAARLRASNAMLRVQFFDAEIELRDEASAATRLTVQVTTRDGSGGEVAGAYVAEIALVRVEGRWIVSAARVLRERNIPL